VLAYQPSADLGAMTGLLSLLLSYLLRLLFYILLVSRMNGKIVSKGGAEADEVEIDCLKDGFGRHLFDIDPRRVVSGFEVCWNLSPYLSDG
jgi:hypothetical protein